MKTLSIEEITHKLEYYCSYQERCHIEVMEKLKSFVLSADDRNTIIVHLITHNFLNEERFAHEFTIGKFHQKKWGKKRISNELKARKISSFLIRQSLAAINEEEYENTFHTLAEKIWLITTESNSLKKQKKVCDYLLRKGFESDAIYTKIKQLEKKSL